MSRPVFWACAVLLPCTPLLTGPPHGTDWVNNVWLVESGADHLARTGLPASSINTAELGGLAFPVFYGYLIYPLLSAVALVVGAENALRLAVAGMNLLQFVLVRKAVRNGGGGELLASTAACLTVWAIYPFTNVYNRGAVMEFLAGGLLTCAVCRWFALLDAQTARQRVRAALELGLLYTLAAGAHPITALYGLAFLAIHAVTGFALTQRAGSGAVAGRFFALVPAAGLVVAVLAPWVYACAQLSDKFAIRGYGLHLYPDTIDCWWRRLLSLPRDAGALLGIPEPPLGPMLDAQMNGPLVLVGAAAAWAAVRCARGGRGWWLAVPTLLGLGALVLSLWVEPYEVLPAPFRMVQFPYRLVTYVNLSALAAVLLAVRLAGERGRPIGGSPRPEVRAVLLIAALGVSAFALGVKLWPATHRTAPVAVAAGRLPDTFNGWDDYSTPRSYEILWPSEEEQRRWLVHERMELASSGRPRYEPLTVKLTDVKVIVVQIQPFPWSKLEVNGHPVPDDHLFVWFGNDEKPTPGWNHRPYWAVLLPPGEHVLVHRFQPPKTWRALTVLSLLTFFCWSGVVVSGVRRAGVRPV